MNKKTSSRRGLIKRGLTLLGGILVFGAGRSSSAATKPVQLNKKMNKNDRGPGLRQHAIEGDLLGFPAQSQKITNVK